MVLRPAVDGPLIVDDMDVDKACISKLLLVIERCVQRTPVATESLVDHCRPTCNSRVLGQGIVVANYRVEGVLELDKPTRLEVPRTYEPTSPKSWQ